MFTKFSFTFVVLVVGLLSTSVTTGSAAPLINPGPITTLDRLAKVVPHEPQRPQRVQIPEQREFSLTLALHFGESGRRSPDPEMLSSFLVRYRTGGPC